jgi:hypothetical protein
MLNFSTENAIEGRLPGAVLDFLAFLQIQGFPAIGTSELSVRRREELRTIRRMNLHEATLTMQVKSRYQPLWLHDLFKESLETDQFEFLNYPYAEPMLRQIRIQGYPWRGESGTIMGGFEMPLISLDPGRAVSCSTGAGVELALLSLSLLREVKDQAEALLVEDAQNLLSRGYLRRSSLLDLIEQLDRFPRLREELVALTAAREPAGYQSFEHLLLQLTLSPEAWVEVADSGASRWILSDSIGEHTFRQILGTLLRAAHTWNRPVELAAIAFQILPFDQRGALNHSARRNVTYEQMRDSILSYFEYRDSFSEEASSVRLQPALDWFAQTSSVTSLDAIEI